ncbi:hypothetical protein ADK60_25335, partial [Streptomyces sp. XY431]|uniref:condensation domain-containing protein n=1 Tax=Streptomyces sp. XY431 TaxID=1415562 RepID=UPI0006BF4D78
LHPLTTTTAKFDLSLRISENHHPDGTPAGLTGTLEYTHDLFDRTTAEQLAQRFTRLLDAIAENPDQDLARIEVLSPAERDAVLVDWNDTAAPVPAAVLPELFEAQVARTPDATALVCDDTVLSYAELNPRA